MAKSTKQSSPVPKLLWGIACLAIIGAIAGGLMITGGPEGERARRMDNLRTNDLRQLQNAVLDEYRANAQLPESLQALQAKNHSITDSMHDPVSGKPYGYIKDVDEAFQLCATFEQKAQREEINRRYENDAVDFERHPAGLYCFHLQKETSKESQSVRWIHLPQGE